MGTFVGSTLLSLTAYGHTPQSDLLDAVLADMQLLRLPRRQTHSTSNCEGYVFYGAINCRQRQCFVVQTLRIVSSLCVHSMTACPSTWLFACNHDGIRLRGATTTWKMAGRSSISCKIISEKIRIRVDHTDADARCWQMSSIRLVKDAGDWLNARDEIDARCSQAYLDHPDVPDSSRQIACLSSALVPLARGQGPNWHPWLDMAHVALHLYSASHYDCSQEMVARSQEMVAVIL